REKHCAFSSETCARCGLFRCELFFYVVWSCAPDDAYCLAALMSTGIGMLRDTAWDAISRSMSCAIVRCRLTAIAAARLRYCLCADIQGCAVGAVVAGIGWVVAAGAVVDPSDVMGACALVLVSVAVEAPES